MAKGKTGEIEDANFQETEIKDLEKVIESAKGGPGYVIFACILDGVNDPVYFNRHNFSLDLIQEVFPKFVELYNEEAKLNGGQI